MYHVHVHVHVHYTCKPTLILHVHVYLCEVSDEVFHGFIKVLSGEDRRLGRVELGYLVAEIRWKQVGVETNHIHRVYDKIKAACVEYSFIGCAFRSIRKVNPL